jgi:hypothetical protein
MSNFTKSQIMNELFQPFTSTPIDFEKIIEGITTFGKIKLNINKFPITKKHLDLEFNIDNSGSMHDKCPDGKTKMDHMNFTVENILRYLQEHDISATVCVNSFDDKIKNIIKSQELNSENIEGIAQEIRKIRPVGGTDIGKVLQMEASFKKPEDYSSDRIFLMFTDGQAVNGITNKKLLKEIADKISDTTTIVTIGCGTDHDYELLSSIASRRNSNYKFIGKLEEAAMACGEVLDKILNKILANVEILVQNGEIYDWKTNKWTNKIQTENIVGECDKTYNVRSLTPAEFSITITGTIVETDELFEYSITDKNMDQDLKKDDWRQQTLELLYEVNEYNRTRCRDSDLVRELKSKLKELMVNMKKYMDDNKLRDDLFMKMLTDDIFTAHTTFGTAYGHMYVASRQTSQATQGIHNNTVTVEYDNFPMAIPTMSRGVTCQMNEDDELPPPLPLKRGVTYQIQQMNEDDEFNLPPPPIMTRGLSIYVQAMNQDEEEEEIIRRNPSSVRNCSMMFSHQEDDDEDNIDLMTSTQFYSMGATPKLKRSSGRSVGFAEEDDVFSRHITLESNISPYANIKTVSIMREVSFTPKKSEDKVKDDSGLP